ncbi:MAG: sulfotransferase [Thermoplasmatales archaeon]|nr:MAG: sulfotransferase [Thermoplasmatales archaeon]
MTEKFKPEWIKKVNEDIIWICQLPRSGGTLLLRLFDSHPEFHCHPAVFGFSNEDRIWPKLDDIEKAKDNALDTIFSYMNLEKFHLRGISKQSSNMEQELYPIYFDKNWYKKIYDLSLEGEKPRDLFNAFFTALFNAWRNNQNLYGNKKYITGQMTLRKPELYQKNYENFKAVYPDGKMIFMIRKPDDWLASAYKLKVSTPYTGLTPNEIIDQYKTHLRQAIDMSKDDSFIIFKFEDLVLNSREIMTKLADKLEIAWVDTLLYPTLNGSPFYQNSSFSHKRKSSIDPSILGKGRELPSNVLSAVDEECMDLYNQVVDCRDF